MSLLCAKRCPGQFTCTLSLGPEIHWAGVGGSAIPVTGGTMKSVDLVSELRPSPLTATAIRPQVLTDSKACALITGPHCSRKEVSLW